MTKQHYRNIALTFFISTVWCVYVFFDYFADRGFLRGLTLYFDFVVAAIFCIGLAILNSILRVALLQKKNEFIKNNFFYTFAGYSNIILSIIYALYLILENQVREFFNQIGWPEILVSLNATFGIIIIYDIYSILLKSSDGE